MQKDAVLNLWAKGETSGLIAARFGSRPEYIRTIIQRARRDGDGRATSPQRGRLNRLGVSETAYANIMHEAERRELSTAELTSRILEVVGVQDLFAAVLDTD